MTSFSTDICQKILDDHASLNRPSWTVQIVYDHDKTSAGNIAYYRYAAWQTRIKHLRQVEALIVGQPLSNDEIFKVSVIPSGEAFECEVNPIYQEALESVWEQETKVFGQHITNRRKVI